MRKVSRVAIGSVVVLIGLVAVVMAIGATLPAGHSASVRATYGASPQQVWKAITSSEEFPQWRSGVDRVEPRTFDDGTRGWVEHGGQGPLPMAIDRSEPPRRLVLRIASDALPFGGSWTYELEEVPGGTRLTITEDGTVTNLLFRFMSRFVFGHTVTMERYLTDLGVHLGESVEPVVVTG